MLTGYDLELDNKKNLEIAERKLTLQRKRELPYEIFKKAQNGDDEAFLRIYEYYRPYVEYLFFKHGGAVVEGMDKEELAFTYKMGLIKAIQLYDKEVYGYMRTCIAGICLGNLDYLKMKIHRKGRDNVGEIVPIGNKFDFGTSLTETSMWTIDGLEREDCREKTNNYIDRFLSLLDGGDRWWLTEYFKHQSLRGFAERLGVTYQNCSQKLKKIEEKLVSKKTFVDMIAGEYYYNGKTVGQISDERGMSRGEVCKAIRTHNYIYNGGDDSRAVSIEKIVAECVLDSDEYGYYRLSTEQPIARLKFAFKDNYKKFINPAIRQVNRATDKLNVVTEIIEVGSSASEEAKRIFSKMTGQEREFFSALYAYLVTGECKPVIEDSVKKILKGSASEGVASK